MATTERKQVAKKAKAGSSATTSLHFEHKGDHLVGIGNLRVVIVQGETDWYAQGLEIDYAAQGDSLESVRERFEQGLCWTIHEHLRVYGTIEKILTPAPPDIWKEMLYGDGKLNRFTQVSWHENIQPKMVEHLPFESISYIQRAA
jgi:hypothetical protein